MANPRQRSESSGFTLVEMIAVIVVMGIISSVAGIGIVEAVKSYRKTIDRSELAEMADSALRRMARDMRYSLPMSTRTPGAAVGGALFLETILTKNGGRYRVGGTELTVNGVLVESPPFVADTEFETLAALSEPPGQVVVTSDLIVTLNEANSVPEQTRSHGAMAPAAAPIARSPLQRSAIPPWSVATTGRSPTRRC